MSQTLLGGFLSATFNPLSGTPTTVEYLVVAGGGGGGGSYGGGGGAGGLLTAAGLAGPLNGSVGATTPSTVVATQVNVTAQGDVRFEDTTGGQYVALQAPGTVSTNVTFTLPGADGSNGEALVTNGSGVLSFGAAGLTRAQVTTISLVYGF